MKRKYGPFDDKEKEKPHKVRKLETEAFPLQRMISLRFSWGVVCSYLEKNDLTDGLARAFTFFKQLIYHPSTLFLRGFFGMINTHKYKAQTVLANSYLKDDDFDKVQKRFPSCDEHARMVGWWDRRLDFLHPRISRRKQQPITVPKGSIEHIQTFHL